MPSLKELTVKNSVFLLLVAIPFAKEKNKCDRHRFRVWKWERSECEICTMADMFIVT